MSSHGMDGTRDGGHARDGAPAGTPIRGKTSPRGPGVGQVRGVLAERVVISTSLDPFLSLRALAVYAGLSTRTLRGYVDLPPDEALPCYRLPGKVVVRKSEYDAWIQRFRARGRPGPAGSRADPRNPLTRSYV
jgi:hypothetical protein